MVKSNHIFLYLRNNIHWLLPCLWFGILIIAGALKHPLWSDEAETALLARNILRYGFPVGWDGVNLMGTKEGILLNNDLIATLAGWPQLFITAGSFFVFGQSPFTGRLPFVLFSLATIPVTYKAAKRLTGSTQVATLSGIILSTSVPFILFSQQARYYPLQSFLGIMFTYLVITFKRISLRWIIMMTACMTALVLNHYLSGITYVIAALFILIPLQIKRETYRKRNFKLATTLSFLAAGLISGFTILLLQPYTKQIEVIDRQFYTIGLNIPQIIASFYAPWNEAQMPPVLLLLPIALVLFWPKKAPKTMSLITALPIIYIALVSLVTAFTRSHLTLTDFRYHTILFPPLSIILAYTVYTIGQYSRLSATIILFLLIMTNILSIPSRPRVYILEYIHELTVEYAFPEAGVAEFLNEHAMDNQTVFLDRDSRHDSILYLLNKPLRFVNRIQPSNPIIKNNPDLPSYLYSYTDKPDWIIHWGENEDARRYNRSLFPPGKINTIDLDKEYEKYSIKVYANTNTRPEITEHMFTPKIPVQDEQIFIYKKL